MKPGKSVWFSRKGKNGVILVEATLVEFGRGPEARVRLADGREMSIHKTELMAKPPKVDG